MPRADVSIRETSQLYTDVPNDSLKLDIGCGLNKTSGFTGVDRVNLPGVDVIHDLDTFPWPFPDDCAEVICANHFLEHVSDIVATLGELHRISARDGLLKIRVPHYASDNFHSDLTHKVAFGYRSFDHFSINGEVEYDFYEPFKFEIVSRRICFMGPDKGFNPFKWLGIEFMANRFARLYERFFVYMLPPAELNFVLRVVKDGGPTGH